MKNFVAGTIFGIIVATVGFGGIARIIDNSIEKVKEVTIEQAQ